MTRPTIVATAVACAAMVTLSTNSAMADSARPNVTPPPKVQVELDNPGSAGNNFGFSTDASGNTVVTAAAYQNVGGHELEGVVYVYQRPSTGWRKMAPTAELTAPAGVSNENFGSDVAISGNTIVVGASGAGDGAVYVYTEPTTGWATTSTPTATLSESDGNAGDGLGSKVAISGSTIAASATGFASDSGAVFVYDEPKHGWADETQDAVLTDSASNSDDAFGQSLALDGDTIVAGSWLHALDGSPEAGDAAVFVKPPAGWTDSSETRQLKSTVLSDDQEFGYSVGVSGDVVAVGAPQRDIGNGSNGGAVYTYNEPAGGWGVATTALKETSTLSEAGGVSGQDQFGAAMRFLGKSLLVGAPGATVGTNVGEGEVYPFVEPGDGFPTTAASEAFTASDGAAGEGFGGSVAIGKTYTAVGSASGSASAVRIFATAPPKLSATSITSKKHLATVRYTLSDKAKVAVVFGTKAHGKVKSVATYTFPSLLGSNVVHVHEKATGKKSLAKGKYTVTLTAKNANGKSAPKTLHVSVK